MAQTVVYYATRRKAQGIFSRSPDFRLRKANHIINGLVRRVLKLEPSAKAKYRYFREEQRIATAVITHPAFNIIVTYEPPYNMPLISHFRPSVTPAEINAKLEFKAQYEEAKAQTLAEIVRKF